MQYPAGSVVIIMNFGQKMGCDLHKMGVSLSQVGVI